VLGKGKGHAEELALKYGARAYTDANAMFNNERIDMVDVCVPTYLHEQYVVMAAEYGADILCEKPFALTREAADHMIQAAKEAKKKLMVAQVLRFWPEYVEIKKHIDNDDLGDIQMVYANRLAQHPDWSDWFKDPNKSGGGLFDLHSHDIDILHYYFGPEKTVYSLAYRNNAGCFNHVSSSLVFQNGVKALAEGGFQMTEGYPFTMTMRVVGTKGTLEFLLSAGFNLENLGAASSRLVYFRNGHSPELLKVEQSDPYLNEIRYFTECVNERRDPDVVPPADSRKVLDVMLSIRDSIETGEVQHL